MNDAILVPLTTQMNEGQLEELELFRLPFSELWSNWESLKSLGLKLGGSFQNKGNGQVSGSSCGVEIHRLKGFYLDFRFFVAEKEPTQFFKVINKISGFCKDSRLHKCLAHNRTSWKEAGVLHEWHGFKADELIKVMFNADLFHSDKVLQPKSSLIRESMSSELAHHLLTFSIYNRMLVIRNLNWIIKPLTVNHQCIQLPSNFA
jgi:hypothetical protein